MSVDRDFSLALDAVNVRCRQRGSEPRAVFLHGFGGDLATWNRLWQAMGDALPMLRYDLRGFGQSVACDESPFSHADDLLAVLDALRIERSTLVGVSMGASIALNFALDHPERVENLVLVSPALAGWEWSESWRALWRPIVERARAGDMEGARRLWWQHPLFMTTRASGAANELRESIERFAGKQWLRDDQRDQLPDIERLHHLKPRTLLMTGSRDLDDFRLIADVIEASVSDLARVDFPGLGHLLHLEDAQVCAARILAFVRAAGCA